MGDKSGIQWTEATWNPIVGCSVVSPGCTNCYAMKQAHRMARMGGKAGAKYEGLTKLVNDKPVWTGKMRLHESAIDQPLRWKRPRMIFVNSMSDLFHEDVPDEWIDRVFAVMALAPRHTFQILTKRAERMRGYLSSPDTMRRISVWTARFDRKPELNWWPFDTWPLANVWLGVSAEDQRRADERVPTLQQTSAVVRFVSAEPLLGPIDMERGGFSFLRLLRSPAGKEYAAIDWIIVGGESGPGARPFRADWAHEIIKQCRAAGIACFVKQLGANVVWNRDDGQRYLSDRKGGDPAEWPAGLRVREMPDYSREAQP